jgi:hypothetical protein
MSIRKKVLCFISGSFFIFCLATNVMPQEKIRIGFSMSLTGVYAFNAEGEINAYTLWSEQINKRGGIFVKDLNKKLPVEFI